MPETYTGDFIVLFPWNPRWSTAVNALTADPKLVLTKANDVEFRYDGSIRKRGGVVKLNQTPLIDVED